MHQPQNKYYPGVHPNARTFAHSRIYLSYSSSCSQTETSPVIDKITTKALASALLDGDEVKALAAYTAVDKTTGISLDVELHPSLPLSGLAGNDAGHTPLHLAAAGCMQNILVCWPDRK